MMIKMRERQSRRVVDTYDDHGSVIEGEEGGHGKGVVSTGGDERVKKINNVSCLGVGCFIRAEMIIAQRRRCVLLRASTWSSKGSVGG